MHENRETVGAVVAKILFSKIIAHWGWNLCHTEFMDQQWFFQLRRDFDFLFTRWHWTHLATMPKRAPGAFSFVLPRHNWNPHVQLWLTHVGIINYATQTTATHSAKFMNTISVKVLTPRKKQRTSVEKKK